MRTPWTVEEARAAGLKSAQLRRERAEQRKLNPPNEPRPNVADPEQTYKATRLARVRKQLDLVDKRIRELAEAEGEALDGQQLNWLCSAQERLSEQERVLSNRPLPGSLKPQSTRTRRQPQSFGPVEE